MDHVTFDKLYKGMHRIIAKNMLREFTIADYPNMSKHSDKSKLHRNVFKVGYPENFKDKILKTTDLELI